MKRSHLRSRNQLNRVTRRWRRALVPALAVLLLSLPLPTRVQAAAGDLDLTFGVGGRVLTDFFGSDDEAHAIVVQPDGKILTAGFAGFGFFNRTFDFAIARYNVDGSLDASFGAGGRVTTDFFGAIDNANGIALLPDGKVVAAGLAEQGLEFDFAVARYNSNGSLDTSFGSGGKVTTDFFGLSDFAASIVIQTDGKLVLAGGAENGSIQFPALVRYNSDGSLDTGFGSGGKVTTGFFGASSSFSSNALQNDGKIVAGGTIGTLSTSLDFGLARYNSNGSLDSSFGSGGTVTTDFFGITDLARGMAIQSDGKIVLVGDTFSNATLIDFALARYTSNGSLDSSFGLGGKVITDFSGGLDSVGGIAIQSNGEIVVAGDRIGGFLGAATSALARYHSSDGSLDASFGSGGKVTGLSERAFDVALQSDGGILASGTAFNGANPDFSVERYKGDSFDICLQDDSAGSLLQLNSTTGAYQFTNCAGVNIAGTGTLIKRAGVIMLQDFSADRKVLVKIDTAVNKASAGIQLYSQGATFTITDRNTTNNTCACR